MISSANSQLRFVIVLASDFSLCVLIFQKKQQKFFPQARFSCLQRFCNQPFHITWDPPSWVNKQLVWDLWRNVFFPFFLLLIPVDCFFCQVWISVKMSFERLSRVHAFSLLLQTHLGLHLMISHPLNYLL